jgi:pimeloyl-ACP methyl ester carboxylesterase
MQNAVRHFAALAALLIFLAPVAFSGDTGQLVRVDHYVRVRSTVPAIEGQTTQIYVREVVKPGAVLRGGSMANRVLLFVHGAGTPAEVAFDVPYADYSWMAYLARAGFDVFSMDMTGYGRSTRPTPMNDPCNLAEEQMRALVPAMLPSPCKASYPSRLTTIASDWNDIGAVVDHLRALRGVEKVSMLAWSLGGPRAGGYASQHPEKVDRLVLLAPAYSLQGGERPAKVPADGPVMSTQSHEDFTTGWDRQVGCPAQYEPAASDAVWSEMLASDPVGATWGTGVRRAPLVTSWGFGHSVVSKMQTPALLFAGAHDAQVPIDRVKALYNDLGSKEKVFIDLACSSHNAMWEKNHLLMFEASLEWLSRGTVQGKKEGMLQLGY